MLIELKSYSQIIFLSNLIASLLAMLVCESRCFFVVLVVGVCIVPGCHKQECCQQSLAYNNQYALYMTKIGKWNPCLNHWLDRCCMLAKMMVWTWLIWFNQFSYGLCLRIQLLQACYHQEVYPQDAARFKDMTWDYSFPKDPWCWNIYLHWDYFKLL